MHYFPPRKGQLVAEKGKNIALKSNKESSSRIIMRKVMASIKNSSPNEEEMDFLA